MRNFQLLTLLVVLVSARFLQAQPAVRAQIQPDKADVAISEATKEAVAADARSPRMIDFIDPTYGGRILFHSNATCTLSPIGYQSSGTIDQCILYLK